MINLCNECNIKEVCVMHADFTKHAGRVSIELTDCDFRQWVGIKYERSTNTIERKQDLALKLNIDRDKISLLSNANSVKKLEESKARANEIPKPKAPLEAKPLKLDHTCLCGTMTFEEDLNNCSKCNTQICSGCATINGDTNQVLCEKCWQEA